MSATTPIPPSDAPIMRGRWFDFSGVAGAGDAVAEVFDIAVEDADADVDVDVDVEDEEDDIVDIDEGKTRGVADGVIVGMSQPSML